MLEWAAQGGGGVTVPGSVQGMFRCTRDVIQQGSVGGRGVVGLDDLGGLFQPW